MNVTDRFLHYISFDTTSDSSSGTHPSTASQLDFAAMLADEMKQMGLTDISCDEYGYVFGTIPSTIPNYKGTILGFIAHMDTVDAAPGANIKPSITRNYDGNDILLNVEKNIVMHTSVFPGLKNLVGKDLIVTDGTTLLGADDKAGVAEILTAAEFLMAHPEISHGSVRVGFTPDEEIGEGADLFDVKRFGADFAYTMDGGECGELEYENFNAASAHLTFCGVSIHPGSAKNKMINSALLAMEYQGMMPEAQKPEHTEGREGFIHLDSIKGDVEKTVSEYIIRDHERNLFEEKKNYMTRAAEYMNSKYGNGTVELILKDSYYNMKQQIEPHMHLVDTAIAVYEKLGITPQIVPIRGGTDGARLSYKGLPCPNLGTGGQNYHGPFEFACIQSMEKCVEVILELIYSYSVK